MDRYRTARGVPPRRADQGAAPHRSKDGADLPPYRQVVTKPQAGAYARATEAADTYDEEDDSGLDLDDTEDEDEEEEPSANTAVQEENHEGGEARVALPVELHTYSTYV